MPEPTNQHPARRHPCVTITYEPGGVLLIEELHGGATPMTQVLDYGDPDEVYTSAVRMQELHDIRGCVARKEHRQ